MKFLNPVEMAQAIVGERLAEGEIAVDATAGNGNDTVFLAGCVGETGRVYAFDIQGAAIDATREKLDAVGMLGRVALIKANHGRMEEKIAPGDRGKVGVVMFNLGYLPGGDKAVVTRPDSTLDGIRESFGWAREGGVVTVVAYTGHPGGAAEADQLEAWMSTEIPSGIEGVRYAPLGRKNAPYLLAFRSRSIR